ncbi:MAG: diadenylate cyclase CdaA [Clostridiales Family XIII bacterium]|jgi:diadenylate cyclase|nr:diadenylate cyclase CdaA [Clostridiales Family XIII bacterium]
MPDTFENLISGFGLWDFIDITLIAFVIYKVLGFIRETRAEQLVKGLVILLAATFFSGFFHLYSLNWLLKGFMQFGVIALVVVFQPELRRGLEHVGRSKLFRSRYANMDKDEIKSLASTIVQAVDFFSANRIGALIVLEREISLTEYTESGVMLDSMLSAELLKNIFMGDTPLHDGAAILRKNRIVSAASILPLTDGVGLPAEIGTRHRAAIGITEVSDSLAIVVSEETGIISNAREGKLTRFLQVKTLEKRILNLYLGEDYSAPTGSVLRKVRRRAPKQ